MAYEGIVTEREPPHGRARDQDNAENCERHAARQPGEVSPCVLNTGSFNSSITITADTYPSLLPETDLAITETVARLVPRARKPQEDEQPASAATEQTPEPKDAG
jgi:hypothetical protein